MINYMLSEKFMIIHLIDKLMTKISSYKMSYYPEQDSHIKSKLELDCLIMQQNLTEKK